MSGADGLDTLLDALPRHDASDDLVARVLAQVEADQNEDQAQDTARRDRRHRFARWAGMAAGLALALGAWWTLGDGRLSSDGALPAPGLVVKGAATAPTASMTLGLSLLRNDVPVALEAGASARSSDKVLLRYTTDQEGFAYLFRLGPDGVEVFHGTATLPGTHHVTVGGQIVGYGLDGLSGEHLFGVAWSSEPWAPADDAAAKAPPGFAAAVGDGSFPRVLRNHGVVVDARPVTVEQR